MNGSPKVRPEVVEAVNAAIERLNYVPNRAARSLASRQTYAIALLVPERVTTFFNDPFFASVVQGITARMEDSDYILNLLVSSSDPTRKTRRYLRGGNVDGAFVVSHHAADRDLADLCDIMPVVFGGRPALADLASCHYVDIDNVHGARTAVEHLVGSGRRRIATITGPADMLAAVDRRSGWLGGPAGGRAARRRRWPIGDFTELAGRRGHARAARRLPDLDAVFVANDLMARGALQCWPKPAVRCPTTSPWSATTTARPPRPLQPQLTTVRPALGADGPPDGRAAAGPAGRRGAAAADLLPTTLVAATDQLNHMLIM